MYVRRAVKVVSTILLFLFVQSTCAQKMRIGLYAISTVKTVEVNYDQGRYVLTADTVIIDTLDSKFSLIVYGKGDEVKLRLDGNDLGSYGVIRLAQLDRKSGFKIRSLTHKSKHRYYWGGLEIGLGEKKLKMVNIVELEDYLPGVVESESGSDQNIDYYKIQATISRTYARRHIQKHVEDGYNLCDHTHCQVYRKRSMRNPDIKKAVEETKGLVLVDSDINLISALFFSNCGGQTCNSEDVWNTELSYLRSIKDPFCKSMPHYYWKKEIRTDAWVGYLHKKMPDYYKLKDGFNEKFKVNYDQGKRRLYYSNAGYSVPLTEIRTDFNLRSTFFSITEKDDNVVFRGRGFGHGVGLCQEGAMKMADLGYSYLEILKFYYSGIHLIHLDDLDFFKME